VAHFGITDLANANINHRASRPVLSDPNALLAGVLRVPRLHLPGRRVGGRYNGVQQGIAYSNIPYQLAGQTPGGANVCGENAVKHRRARQARRQLDRPSVTRSRETVTDPGAEDVVGSGGTHVGGWYDTVDAQ